MKNNLTSVVREFLGLMRGVVDCSLLDCLEVRLGSISVDCCFDEFRFGLNDC